MSADGLTGHIFETRGMAEQDAGRTWAAPFIVELTATDVANGYVDLPDTMFITNSLFVFKNGVAQSIGCDFTLSSNRITFTRRLRVGHLLQIRYQT